MVYNKFPDAMNWILFNFLVFASFLPLFCCAFQTSRINLVRFAHVMSRFLKILFKTIPFNPK